MSEKNNQGCSHPVVSLTLLISYLLLYYAARLTTSCGGSKVVNMKYVTLAITLNMISS